MEITRIFEVIAYQKAKYPNEQALIASYDQSISYSIEECAKEIDLYSHILLNLGLKKGDILLIFPESATIEWLFLDFAAQQLGIIVAPVHPTFQKEQFDYILEETESKVCFVLNEDMKEKFFPSDNSLSTQVFTIHGEESAKNTLAFLKKSEFQKNANLEALKKEILPEDISTIIYTSGTTGLPKGVMLTHKNLTSNLNSLMTLLPLDTSKRVLSFLPISHIFERSTIYAYFAIGCSIYLAGYRSNLLNIAKEVKPHFFTAVPRILEKIADLILEHRTKKGRIGKKLIDWALRIGANYSEKKRLNLIYFFKNKLARLIILNKFRTLLGNAVEAIIVGAAYLNPDLGRTLAASGIKIREGYGLTETSPVVTFNRFMPGLYAFGTVGVPVPNVEVKIDNPDENGEGEILVKGNNVMKGYFKKEEITKEVFDKEGWFKTGDIGRFVNKRFLQITDRKKDIFKTSSGKYIAPQALEKHFSQAPLIDQIMVLGFQKPFVSALIRPNYILLREWCLEQNIHWTSPQYMAINIKVIKKMQEVIDQLNMPLPNYQKVKKFHLIHEEWSTEGGQLSYTMKFRRPNILAEYNKAVQKMYGLI